MSRTWRRRLRSRFFDVLMGPLVALLGAVSWPRAQAFGRGLGRLAWRLSPRDRRRIDQHLQIAFPDLDADARARLGRASLRHLGTSIGECLHLLSKGPDEICSHLQVEGAEHLEAMRAAGKPVILVTGHCGNWELLAALAHSNGLVLHALQRRLDDPALGDVIGRIRRHLGAVNLPRGSRESARAMLKVLREGGILIALLDQDIDTDGVWVPFFGRLAFTPVVAARLAARHGAVAATAFSERLEDGRHRLSIDPPVDLPDDIEQATAMLTERIERHIRRRPEQWVWMHRRWRRRPPEAHRAG